jgi:two-component system, LytTR family, response regulator
MNKVLIVDDEEDARTLLRQYILQHEHFTIVAEATNGLEAVEYIQDYQPDTVFLDIQMPGLNGFEVLTRLHEIPKIVFSTAYDQYAIKAFEVHALDYLLKPYSKQRFDATVQRILTHQQGIVPLTEALLQSKTPYPDRIILHQGVRKMMVPVQDIVYAEASGDYTKVLTVDKEYLSVKGITELQEKLSPEQFLRLHRSYFVNKTFVQEIQKKERYYFAILSTQHSFKISESYLPNVKNILF